MCCLAFGARSNMEQKYQACPPTLTMHHLPFCLLNFHSHPGYFGKVGMRHFHKQKNKYFCPVVNVESLPTLISAEVRYCFNSSFSNLRRSCFHFNQSNQSIPETHISQQPNSHLSTVLTTLVCRPPCSTTFIFSLPSFYF
jgi:hypothetical protein